MTSGFTINAILAFILGAALSSIWSLANVLQLISNYPLIEIAQPSNTIEIFAYVDKIANFELVPENQLDYIVSILFNFPEFLPYT